MKVPHLPQVDLTSLDLLTREQLYAYIDSLKHEIELIKARYSEKMSDWAWERQAARGGQM